MTRPTTTVVTPTNRKRLDFRLTAYFACLAQQTTPPDEIVLVSEEPFDPAPVIREAEAIVGRRLASPVHLLLSESPSLVHKRNLGTNFATGDVVLMMDDDDLYAPRYIETTLRQLDELRTPYLIVGLGALAYRPADRTFKELGYASGPTVAFYKRFFDGLGIRYTPDRVTADGQDVHESITLLDAVQYLGLPYPWARRVGETLLYMRHGDGFDANIQLGEDGWTPDTNNQLLTRVAGPRLTPWLTGQSYSNASRCVPAVTTDGSAPASPA